MREFTNRERYTVWLRARPLPFGRIYALFQDYSDAEEVFSDAKNGRALPKYLREKDVSLLRAAANQAAVDEAVAALDRHGIDVVLRDSPLYPPLMQEIHQPPPVLYIRGEIGALTPLLGICVVGMRNCSPYGIQAASYFASCLAEQSVCIVSGLARGIDAAAHQGALTSKRDGCTIAVLAGGLDQVYPPEHGKLFDAIAECGAVVSENPPGSKIYPYSAPLRNRLMAGLSHGVLLVEAACKSGTQYTIDAALNAGRSIFAIPGRLGEAGSELPNRLIAQGAKIALCAEDIFEEFRFGVCEGDTAGLEGIRTEQTVADEPDQSQKILVELSPEETKIYDALKDRPLSADELVEVTRLPVYQLLILITRMEQKEAIVKDMESGRFSRKNTSIKMKPRENELEHVETNA